MQRKQAEYGIRFLVNQLIDFISNKTDILVFLQNN